MIFVPTKNDYRHQKMIYRELTAGVLIDKANTSSLAVLRPDRVLVDGLGIPIEAALLAPGTFETSTATTTGFLHPFLRRA